MRLAVAATPAVAIPTLDWLNKSAHELVRVITKPDQSAGRGRELSESVVSTWAKAHGVECAKPERAQDLALHLNGVDLVITIGYGFILPNSVLSVPQHGFINMHFSLLPKWRGAAPVQRALLHGDDHLGISVFALDAGMDTGPIYVQEEIAQSGHESAGEMLETMAARGPELIARTIALIESGVAPTAQSETGASNAPKISKQEARIDWTAQAELVDRHIRAFTPDPGAWTTWRDSSMRIDRAHIREVTAPIPSGVVIVQDGSIFVGCGEGTALVLEEVTPAGKKRMSAKSWFNGARIATGERFV